MFLILAKLQVVSDDGKKVRRQQPFTESDMEELQVRFDQFCFEVLLSFYVVLV